MTNGPVEPNADLRAMAAAVYEIFTSLVQAGFAREEALQIVAMMIMKQQ